MNIWDILIIAALAAAVIAALLYVRRNGGKCSCCDGCAKQNTCTKKQS